MREGLEHRGSGIPLVDIHFLLSFISILILNLLKKKNDRPFFLT